MDVDLRIQRVGRIEIKKAGRNFEPAERKRCIHLVQSNPPVQTGMQSAAGQMQISDRAAVGEITANQQRILGLDRYVAFPIAKRRLGNGKVRTRNLILPRATSRQADWVEINVFQELTVRNRERS